jgi:uncharacterized membrane protein (DUF485 family)
MLGLAREDLMTQSRPFTMLAAIIFLLMAVVHAYRLATHFQIVVGTHAIPMSVSWIGVAVPAVLGILLLREARR